MRLQGFPVSGYDPVTVHLAGGDLLVELSGGEARLTGPAEEICLVELAQEFQL